MYIKTNMNVITSNEKRGHEFKNDQWGVYVKFWREKRKGRNITVIL